MCGLPRLASRGEGNPMEQSRMTRRALLGWGAGAAGAAALGVLPGAFARAADEPALPDLSAKAPSLPVAIGRCESYDRALVTERLAKLFDQAGGIRKLVNGKTVTVKVNITGNPGSPCLGLPAQRTYHVHFNSVLATA